MPLSAIDFYNSLAKTLASRLKFELCPHEMKMISQLNCTKCVEAVIREAIEKTLIEAGRVIEERDTIRNELAHIFTASNDCECEICERVADKFRRVSTKAICPECVSKGG